MHKYGNCPFKLPDVRLPVMADSTYDGIILGTGHNSLILQAYLCRAGLRVISLDRNAVPSGGLRTEEWPVGSGFLHTPTRFTTEA